MGGRVSPEAIADSADNVIAFVVIACSSGTNGSAPRGRIQIEEVLRGTLPCELREASFPPPSDEGFYAIRGSGAEGLARYNATPRMGPPANTRLVAVVHPQADGSLLVEQWASWPDSKERRARFRNGSTG